MSLIPYPDVPALPGVPPLPRLPSSGVSLAQLASTASAPTQAVPQGYSAATSSWQITNTSGAVLLTPDSVLEFEYRGEMKIPTYPVEQGSFQSYNKVYVPFDARMTCACNGNGAMTREAFLGTIEALRQSLELVSIVTPDEIYQPCNLIHVDYRRHARNGATMIVAQLWFQEIRDYGPATITTAQPSGASAQPVGQVSPVDPTTQQQASYNGAPINGGAAGIITSGIAVGAY